LTHGGTTDGIRLPRYDAPRATKMAGRAEGVNVASTRDPHRSVDMNRHWPTKLSAVLSMVLAVGCTNEGTILTPPAAARHDISATVTAAQGELVLDNLANPRALTFGREGALYVAEAGRGGAPQNSGPCFIILGQTMCYGPTGAVTRLWKGERERVATGLPSYAQINSGRAEGPNGISINGLGNVWVVVGLEGNPELRDAAPELAGFAQLVHLAPSALSPGNGAGNGRRAWEFVADLGQYERDVNPDCGDLDSNPFGVLADGNDVIIADAGANTFVRRAANGTLSSFAVFSNNSTIPGPGCPAPSTRDFVPTSVIRGPDGAYYMGHLNGLPIAMGSSSVWRMEPGGVPQPYLTGFTWILALAFDADRNLYVLQHSDGATTAAPGSLVRVAPDGTRSLIVTGIPRPGGLAVDPGGAVYISMIPGTNYKAPGEVRRYTP
jgi:hypothetical protein